MPILNHSTIATSGFDEDGLTTFADGDLVLNLGEIRTSGDFADGISATADDLRIGNYGSIFTSGGGSYAGLIVGTDAWVTNHGLMETQNAYFTDTLLVIGGGFRVDNYGIIRSTGEGVFWRGIATYDRYDVHGGLIRNFGLVQGDGGLSMGINMVVWSDGRIENYGRVEISGWASSGIFATFFQDSEYGAIANYGIVKASGELSLGIGTGGPNSFILNTGTIDVAGQFGVGVLFGGPIGHQSLQNTGTIVVNGAQGTGVLCEAGSHDIVNCGLIQAERAIATLPSWWTGLDPTDRVTNYGQIFGAVDLGGGDDTYIAGATGRLTGELTLGPGDDLLVVKHDSGQIVVTDFKAGEGSEDAIDLSAFHFVDLADVLAAANEAGSDTLLNLGPDNWIRLKGVAVSQLHVDDFIFADPDGLAIALWQNTATHDWMIA